MQQIKNISSKEQSITGIPTFAPDESRLVTHEEAKILLNNPNFALCSKPKEEKKKSK